MIHIHTCPRCQQTISEERRMEKPAVCDNCGFVASGRERRAGRSLERRFMMIAIGAGAVLLFSFMQIVSWGNYAIEAIPLEIGNFTHSNSAPQLERLIQISFELHKYDLTEACYADLARTDHAVYLRLGKFQMTRGKYADAAESFRQYFATNNGDLEAHYLYARALAETQKIDEAAKHFDYVLRSKPGVRQVTVLHYYVKALTLAGRYQEARKVIDDARRADRSAGTFMDTEYKVILERLNSHS